MTGQRALVSGVIATAAVEALVWLAASRGWMAQGLAIALLLAVAWAFLIVLVVTASKQIDALRHELETRHDLHRATLDQVEQLAALNEMLLTLGRSRDVGLAFQALARRIGRLVPCDRLGLALIKDTGHEMQTYSARVSEPERRKRPRPELEYNLDRSVFGQVIRTCDSVLIDDLAEHATDYHDASVLASQGFRSALVLPLISRNRAIGALTVVSRTKRAFTPLHRDAMQPLVEVLAFAFLAQQQHAALARFRTMETLAEMSLSLAADINSALQTIIGHGGVMQLEHPAIAPDVDVIMRQAERINDLLERMRRATNERLGEVNPALGGAIPSSPEAFERDEEFN